MTRIEKTTGLDPDTLWKKTIGIDEYRGQEKGDAFINIVSKDNVQLYGTLKEGYTVQVDKIKVTHKYLAHAIDMFNSIVIEA